MEKGRRRTQILSLFLVNSYWLFLWKSPIYQGWAKRFCFPGLNCYSCPAATLSCPLGALQNALAGIRPALRATQFHLGAYVIGSLGLVGSLIGRFPCGWFCPFGFFQEWLYRIPVKKFPLPRFFRLGPYLFLAVFVVLLPLVAVDVLGYGSTWFCKFVCPAGTIEAGLPLLAMEPGLRNSVGWLFAHKMGVLSLILGWCVVTNRAFCRSVCPLGAIFGLFNRVSFLKLSFHPDRCVECRTCNRICPVDVSFFDGRDDVNTAACIRCMRCVSVCPADAVTMEFWSRKGETVGEEA